MFVIAYPRETQEMVMDAHNRASACFGGVPKQVVYDNLKTVVDAVFTGKERQFNRRFMVLANHYLFEPVACTPAAGWEKGQIENQVGNIREWLFTPRLRFKTFAELNAWLAKRCEELASRKHPTKPTQTIADCFAQEQHLLRKVDRPFAGYLEHLVKVSKLCLVRWNRNRYRVPAKWVNKGVSLRVTAYPSVPWRTAKPLPNTSAVLATTNCSVIPGITYPYWQKSRAPYAMAFRFKIGSYRSLSSKSGKS